jgi:hypothetical protein
VLKSIADAGLSAASVLPNLHHRRIIPLMARRLRIFEMDEAADPVAARDEQHPRVTSSKSKLRSPDSLHGLEQDFGDYRKISRGVHSHDFVHQNLPNQEKSKKSRQELL